MPSIRAAKSRGHAGQDTHRDANHQRDSDSAHERLSQKIGEEVGVADAGNDGGREGVMIAASDVALLVTLADRR